MVPETDLIEALDRYAQTIDVGDAPLTQLLRDGRRVRVRRRRAGLVGATTAIILAVAAAAVVPAELGSDDRGEETTADHPASPDLAATGERLVERAERAFGSAYPNLPPGLYAAQDDGLDQLPPAYEDNASMLSVSYRVSTGAALRLWTGRATDPSGEPLEKQCTYRIAMGDTCRVLTAASGVQAMETTSHVFWADNSMGPGRPYQNLSGFRGAPVHAGAGIDTSRMTSWYEHTVWVTRPDGSSTLATESVLAADLPSAQALFRVDTDQLLDLVTDPHLAIPPPPSAGPGCGPWTLVDHGRTCPITSDDRVVAADVARQVASQAGQPLTRATFWVTAGTEVTHGALACDSGRLVHLVVEGARTLLVTADAASGTICLNKEQRGDYAPTMGGEQLDLTTLRD
jgi:hypothetical protein